MRTKELLLECKVKLGVPTDYKLAAALKIPRARISDYMLGKTTPDTYALMKIAECLKLNPLELIAEFEETTAKREEEKRFWADFRQRAGRPLKGFIAAFLCIATLLIGSGQANTAAGGFRRLKHA